MSSTQRLIFVIFVLLGLLGGLLTNYTWSKNYRATVFFTVGIHAKSVPIVFDSKNLFNLSREADDFTSTIQGWLLFPKVQEKIITTAKLISSDLISLRSKKQERQNVIVFITAPNKKTAEKLASATLKTLRKEMNDYARKTKRTFILSNDSWIIEPILPNYLANILAGLLLGGFIGGLIISYQRTVNSKNSYKVFH